MRPLATLMRRLFALYGLMPKPTLQRREAVRIGYWNDQRRV
jgi:hypothetical protein